MISLHNLKSNLQVADGLLALAEKDAAALGLVDEKRDIEKARSDLDSAMFEIDRKRALTSTD